MNKHMWWIEKAICTKCGGIVEIGTWGNGVLRVSPCVKCGAKYKSLITKLRRKLEKAQAVDGTATEAE